MRTKIYEIADEDVLETFFGENPKPASTINIAESFGDLIYDGDVDWLPEGGGQDTVTLDGEGETIEEYMMVVKTYHADKNLTVAIVHKPHFSLTDVLSS